MSKVPDRVSIAIEEVVAREFRIESAHTGYLMYELIRESWEMYKKANPQPWRPISSQKTKAGSALSRKNRDDDEQVGA